MTTAEQAAAAAAATLLAEPSDEAEETPSSEETDVEETETPQEPVAEEEEFQLPSFEMNEPEDLAEELYEEDEDEDDELLAGYGEYDEDEVDPAILKRLKTAEKKAAHFEQLRAKDARKKWISEAEKYYPLSTPVLGNINATSRRAFMKEAKEAHLAVEVVLKPIAEQYQSEFSKLKEKALAEAREEARKAWGEPHEGQQVPSAVQEQNVALEKARQRGDLSDRIKAMMFPKKES